MKGKTDAKTPEESIARLEDTRRGDIQRVHDLVQAVVPGVAPAMLTRERMMARHGR